MATVENIQLTGFRELEERLKALALDFKEGSKIARATTNAGAQVIKKLAIQKAPLSPPEITPDTPPGGTLKKNIIVKYVRKSKRFASEHSVTVRRGKGKLRVDPYQVGRFQEFGTVKQGPQPYLRPALDQGKTAAIEAMKKRLTMRIEKAERGGK